MQLNSYLGELCQQSGTFFTVYIRQSLTTCEIKVEDRVNSQLAKRQPSWQIVTSFLARGHYQVTITICYCGNGSFRRWRYKVLKSVNDIYYVHVV
jgi:hypothetical protein